MSGIPTNYGRNLNREWNIGASHALYHKEGSWYMPPLRFPAVLIDPDGYVVFQTEEQFQGCQYLRIGERVHVPDGIRQIPGYKRTR